MKSVLISIKPQWCRKILNGEKLIEIRKSAPRVTPPFKCYIYCTQGREMLTYEQYCGYDMKTFEDDFVCNKKVIAEFICDKIIPIRVFGNGTIRDWNSHKLQDSCLSYDEIAMYIGTNRLGYAWHISDLKVYDKPKNLCEFFYPCEKQKYPYCFDCEHGLQKGEERPMDGMRHCDVPCGNWVKRPPQSWCYVEE